MMIKILKIVGSVMASLLGLVVIAFLALKLITDNQYREWITSAVESATGRDFSMGEFSLDLGTSLDVRAGSVRLANAEWSEQADMLTLGALEAEVNLLTLLKGIADVRFVTADVDVLVETGDQGKSNWALDSGATSEEEEPDKEGSFQLPIEPLIRELRMEDTVISLVTGPGMEARKAVLENLLIETPTDITTLTLAATIDGIPIDITGDLGDIGSVLTEASNPLRLDGKIEENTLKLGGTWGPLYPKPNLALQIVADVPSAAKVANMVGADLSELGKAHIETKIDANDGHFTVSEILTNLEGDAVRLSLDGSVDDLLGKQDLDLNISATTGVLNKLLTRLGIELPTFLPPNLNVSADIRGGLDPLEIHNIKMKVADEGLDILIEGSVGDVFNAKGVDGLITLRADSTDIFSKYSGIRIPEIGALSIDANLKSADEQLQLSDLKAGISSSNINVQIAGGIDDVITISGINLKVGAEISSFSKQNLADIEKTLEQFQTALPMEFLPQSVSLTASASGNREQLAITDIDAKVTDEGLEVEVTGSIDNVMTLDGVNAAISVNGQNTSVFSKYAGMPLPDFGAVEVAGKIRSTGEVLQLAELDARIVSDNIKLQLSGGLDDVMTVKGIQLDLASDIGPLSERNIEEIRQLVDSLEVEVPMEMLPQSLSLAAKADGSLEELALKDIRIAAADEGLEVSLDGNIEDALSAKGVSISANVSSTGTSIFSKYTGKDIPDLGPVEASASFSSREDSIVLENLDATVGTDSFNAKLTASIEDMLALTGVNAVLESSLDSAATLSDMAGTALPATDPIQLHAELASQTADQTGPATLTLDVSSGGTQVELDALVRDLRSAGDVKMDFALRSDSLAELNQFVQKELPDKGPLSLSGTMQIEPQKYALRDFDLRIADQRAHGDVSVAMTPEGDLSLVKGQLLFPYLDLSPFFVGKSKPVAPGMPVEVDAEAEHRVRKSTESDDVDEVASDRLFPTDPLPLEKLRLVDVDMRVEADRLVIGKLDGNNFKLHVTMQDGLLEVEPITGVSGEGTLDGYIHFDARKDIAELDTDIVSDSMPLPYIGGKVDLKFALKGEGESVAEILGAADGRLIAAVQDATIPHSFATNFGSGLMSLSAAKEETALECAILKMQIEDGIAEFDDTLAAQLTEVTWHGGGKVNLKTEKLGVAIKPKPRKGLGISVTGGLANLFYVGGSLKSPSVGLNPTGLVKSYGKYAATAATGGLSLLAEGLFNRITAGEDLCEEILEGTIFDEDDK